MFWYKWIIGCVLLLLCKIAAAQCPQPSFSIPDTVCINEPFNIINTTTGAERYEWDFCSGDLEKEPDLHVVTTLSSAVIPTDITTVFDGTNWYGFVCSRNNNKILRLNFGNNLYNQPSVTDLGNIAGQLNFPNGIKILKEDGNWYGLLVNILGNASNNLLKLNFGNSLENIPTIANVVSISSILEQPRGIDIVQENNNQLIAVITNYGGKKITIVNFGNSINNMPASADIINVGTFSDQLAKVTLFKHCDSWHAFIIGTNFYRLDFGSSLFSIPIVNDVSSTISSSVEGISNIKLSIEEDIVALAVTRLGRLHKINFGSTILNQHPQVEEINTNGLVNDLESLELIKEGSEHKGLLIDWGANQLVKLIINNTCTSTKSTSTTSNAINVSYTTGGMKKITLTAYDSNGNINTTTDSVFVRPAIANEFIATKLCEGTAAQFTAPVAPAGNKITSWVWDFGDGNTSTEQNPIHQYATAGVKNVSLTTTDICNNSQTINRSITIYQESTPEFTAPAEICSYEPVSFIDASAVTDDEIISWQWNFGNGDIGTGKNPTYTYMQSGDFQVILTITLKSGCTANISKIIAIKPGANVDFSVQNACFGNQTSFSDLTTFATNTSLDARVWDFGDGNTSTLANPTHTYAATGSYTVTLTVQNNIGCITTHTKQIEITEVPQPNFSFSLTCSEESTSFFDESTTDDGSITQWQWHFNDPSSGTNNVSSIRNPTHTFSKPGVYEVQLKVYTSNGCTDSLSKTITVISSPTAAFVYQINCASQEVQFTDQSVPDENNPITDWYWDMGDGTISLEKNPFHMYTLPGAYTVNLIVTSSSRCTNKYSQKIIIYAPPIADFSIQGKPCINNPVTFVANVSSSSDPVTNWVWDFGALGMFTNDQPQLTFSDASNLTIPVELTITTASGCVASIKKSVLLQNGPDAQFAYAPLTKGIPLDIKFTTISSSDAVNFEWNFGDGTTSKEPDPIHTYYSSGTYTVQLIASNAVGCTTRFSEEVIINDIPSVSELKLETLSATVVNNIITVSVRLYNNSTEVIETLQFNAIAEANNPYIELWNGSLKPGTVLNWAFAIPVSTAFSIPSAICVFAEDQATRKASNSKCVSLTDRFISFNPSPNPAYDKIKLSFVVPNDGKVEIIITDVLGKKIDNFETAIMTPGFHEMEYNVWHISKGLYYFRFKYEGMVQVRKVVIK